MSYNSMAAIQRDGDFRLRLTACVAMEGYDPDNPWNWVDQRMWRVAAIPGFGDKWASALVSHKDDADYSPGYDEACISDQEILAAVQFIHQQDLDKLEAERLAAQLAAEAAEQAAAQQGGAV